MDPYSILPFYYDIAAVSFNDSLQQGFRCRMTKEKSSEFLDVLKDVYRMTPIQYREYRSNALLAKMDNFQPLDFVETIDLQRLRGMENYEDYLVLRDDLAHQDIKSLYQYSFAEMLMDRKNLVAAQSVSNGHMLEFMDYLNPDNDPILEHNMRHIINDARQDANIYLLNDSDQELLKKLRF